MISSIQREVIWSKAVKWNLIKYSIYIQSSLIFTSLEKWIISFSLSLLKYVWVMVLFIQPIIKVSILHDLLNREAFSLLMLYKRDILSLSLSIYLLAFSKERINKLWIPTHIIWSRNRLRASLGRVVRYIEVIGIIILCPILLRVGRLVLVLRLYLQVVFWFHSRFIKKGFLNFWRYLWIIWLSILTLLSNWTEDLKSRSIERIII